MVRLVLLGNANGRHLVHRLVLVSSRHFVPLEAKLRTSFVELDFSPHLHVVRDAHLRLHRAVSVPNSELGYTRLVAFVTCKGRNRISSDRLLEEVALRQVEARLRVRTERVPRAYFTVVPRGDV